KKIANIVITFLSTLLLALESSLEILQTSFDLFDITHLKPSERQEAWEKTLSLSESEHGRPLNEHLAIIRSFSTEIASNFQAGIFTSPEADLLKKRLDETIPNRDARSRVTPEAINIRRHEKSQSRSSHSRTYSEEPSGDETDTSSITLASSKSNYTGEMKWFWLSQADTVPGYFATPWKELFSATECIGTISIVLKSLETYTNYNNSQYVVSQNQNRKWLQQGKLTYPSYAHNAAGGIVVAGTYQPAFFNSFTSPLPPLELLTSYEHQVDRNFSSTAQAVIDSTAEIMGFDTWLSISGRQPEIIDGSSGLLRTMPTLIQQIMMDFHLEFTTLDRTSKDGGSRIINTISESLVGYLKEQGLSDAEQLFGLVALLRTVRMGLCIARGTDTGILREVLVNDVQVYLA
ncbi:MAG: hypothetical protein Q9169_008680, partial [Polycauliona sp. 2 TL-2023]